MEQKILNKSRQLFYTYGIKNITMEDISKNLGISKKTIYKYYKNKNAIVHSVVEELLKESAISMNAITDKSTDVVEEVYSQMYNMGNQVQLIKLSFFLEIEKSYPELMEKIAKYKAEILSEKIKSNLRRGKESGVYRAELDLEEVALIRLGLIENSFTNNTFLSAGWHTKDILITLTNFYLHGITNQQGKELINKYIKKAG
ncbi:TetR/AcrR family transcriptional regulator [Pedobacter flavus]|uniref:TetR/AcrR family transcriptional regulator n=1 Tax=Pedobacter flavus TaxID=3113906 RepID=A0ABU7H3S2_9SPHI|nr:TetR/AcrR family transcriptional regulator [Pedobacter sp. VNH31]MEE1885915.1 TetR/AcrR family transcriptional regulator [Pedobacter sp. VNH31]